MNPRRGAALALVVATSAWTYSCSEEQPTGSAVEGSFGQLTQAICTTAMRCCNRGEISLMMGPYVNVDNCADRQSDRARLSVGATLEMPELGMPQIALPNVGAVKQAVIDGRVNVDSEALEACRAFLNAMTCNELLSSTDETTSCLAPAPEPETPCDPQKMFVGQVPEGGRCSSPGTSLECEPGLVCFANSQLGVFGECAQPSRIGEACFSDGFCEAGAYCSQLDGTCQPFRQRGETCVYSDREEPAPSADTLLLRCDEGLSCDPVTDTCVAPCERGASCSDDAQCDEEQELRCIVGRCDRPRVAGLPCATNADCAEGLHCADDPEDDERRLCQERLAVGEACESHAECETEFCEPDSLACQAKAAADSACPSGLDQECDQGTCESELVACTLDSDCPLSGLCNIGTGICSSYCVALRPEGAQCTVASECASGACIVGFCRALPLVAGQECTDHDQCESEFCNYADERVCAALPLNLGQRCLSDSECESRVCFGASSSTFNTCINGLDEGEACGQPGLAPCNPKRFYCDSDLEPAACAPLREAGEDCESSVQCRGNCIVRFGRKMCDARVDPTEVAICSGDDPMMASAPAPEEE